MAKILDGFVTWTEPYFFSDEDYQQMTGALDVPALKEDQREEIQQYCDRYLVLWASFAEASRPGKVQKWLDRVHNDARNLACTLSQLRDRNAHDAKVRETVLSLICLADSEIGENAFNHDLSGFTEKVSQLESAAKEAIARLPKDRGGRAGNLPLSDLIANLAMLFQEMTGREKTPGITRNHYPEYGEQYRGRFFKFVNAFLAPLGPEHQRSNQALGKACERVLSDLRKKLST